MAEGGEHHQVGTGVQETTNKPGFGQKVSSGFRRFTTGLSNIGKSETQKAQDELFRAAAAKADRLATEEWQKRQQEKGSSPNIEEKVLEADRQIKEAQAQRDQSRIAEISDQLKKIEET